jgi:hypothetical protein
MCLTVVFTLIVATQRDILCITKGGFICWKRHSVYRAVLLLLTCLIVKTFPVCHLTTEQFRHSTHYVTILRVFAYFQLVIVTTVLCRPTYEKTTHES